MTPQSFLRLCVCVLVLGIALGALATSSYAATSLEGLSGCETSKAAPLGGLGILLGAWLMWRQRRPKMRPSQRDKAKDTSKHT